MSASSYQQHVPFLLDFPYLPFVSPFDPPQPSTQPQAGDLASAYSTFFPCYYNPFDAQNINIPAETTPVDAGISTVTYNATTTPTPESSSSLERARDVPPRDNVISSPSSSVQPSDVASKTQCSLDKKRKDRQRCRFGSTSSKEAKEAMSRKLRRCSGAAKEAKDKAQKEPPTGYIHVRARRGQARDSHSLAERVRRERIRERMKMLQGLVPGCDKVVGKALLLDEIINYVQSLQNQVEFLSMKLASMNAILYDFDLDSEDHMALPEKLENMSPTLTNVQGTSHIQHTAFPDTTNNYTVPGTSVPFLPHGEGPSCSSLDQDRGSNFAIPVGDRRQSFLNQVKFSHMSSFQ